MSREKVHGRFGNYEVPQISREYGLGVPDVVFAEDMASLRRVLKTGEFGWCKSIEDWIEWHIYPQHQDDALEVVARSRREKAAS